MHQERVEFAKFRWDPSTRFRGKSWAVFCAMGASFVRNCAVREWVGVYVVPIDKEREATIGAFSEFYCTG